MTSTVFSQGTLIESSWLNDVNSAVYKGVDLVRAGADPTGVTDCTSILIAAIAQAKVNGSFAVVIPRGKFLVNTGAIDLANVAIIGNGVQESSTPYSDAGSVFLLTSTTTSPFTLGRGVTIQGMSFFYPNQTDAVTPPTVYPPLFTGTYVTQFKFLDNTVVNAYQFLKITTGSVGVGDCVISRNRIYAIDRTFWLLNGAPEVLTVTENLFSWGVYEDVVNAGPNYYLRNYTAGSGEFFRIDVSGGSYTSVDGLDFASNLVFGYRYGVRVVSGTLNVSTIGGNKFDAVSTVLSVEGSAALVNSLFEGNLIYSYKTGDSTTEFNSIVFSSSAGTSDVTVVGNNFAYTRGSHITWNSLFSDEVHIVGNRFAAWGQSTQASVTSYFGVQMTDAGVKGLVEGNSFIASSGSVAHQRVGVGAGGSLDLFIAGNMFNSNYIGVWLVSTLANRCVVQGNYATNTVGSQSFRDDVTTAGVVECIWNTWDKSPAINSFPAFSATVASAQTIAVGTKTKINFGTEVFDGDGNYDPTTSTFTAPVTGLYEFAVAITNDAGVTGGDAWKFTVDATGGATQAKGIGTEVAANVIGAASAFFTTLLQLTAGDAVTVNVIRVVGAGSYIVINDTAVCHFTGKRVQ